MSKKLNYLLVTFVILIYVSTITANYVLRYRSKYNPHSGLPIIIQSDHDFKRYRFPGKGTSSNPYIIENLNVSTSEDFAIVINSTSKSFIIRNCHLSAALIGIYITNIFAPTISALQNNVCIDNGACGICLESVYNLTIENNFFSKNDIDIYIDFSENIFLTNNSCLSNSLCSICVDFSVYIHLKDNSCSGISAYHVNHLTLLNNSCTDSHNGIKLEYVSHASIHNCTLSSDNFGISLVYSSYVILGNNMFINCGLEIHFSDNTTLYTHYVKDNIVNNKALGFFQSVSDFNISNTLYGQLFLINCSRASISNQTFTNVSYGMSIYHCSNLTFRNNTCIDNEHSGISILNSQDISFISNNCSDNELYGISLLYSQDISFINNTCSYNGCGISISESSNSFLINNTCNANSYGIIIEHSSDYSFLINNTCNDNTYRGIYLSFFSYCYLINNTCNTNEDGIVFSNIQNSTITNNIISNNSCYGLLIPSSDYCVIHSNSFIMNSDYAIYCDFRSNFNYIYHNNFFTNNPGGSSQAYDEAGDNFWYNETISEGNYWSDWSGVGYYEIDGASGATDLYPLTNPLTII